jgi:hypothetical protein
MATITPTRVRRLASMPRTSLVVPTAAALAGAAFFAWKPGVALSAVASLRAAGFAVVVGAMVLVLGWALPRLGGGFAVTATAQLVPVVVALVVTVLPSLRTTTVNDPLPGAPLATSGPSAPGPQPLPTTRAGAPVAVSRTDLSGIKHRASGSVVLIQLADGSQVIRLEHLDVEPGPDYHVFVVPGPGHHRPDGGARLGKLHGNRGNQNYPVPAGIDVARPVTVLIWCRAFAVPVAAATLR